MFELIHVIGSSERMLVSYVSCRKRLTGYFINGAVTTAAPLIPTTLKQNGATNGNRFRGIVTLCHSQYRKTQSADPPCLRG
jgi:hypothetical protein